MGLPQKWSHQEAELVHFQPFKFVNSAEHILHSGGVHAAMTLFFQDIDQFKNFGSIFFHNIELAEHLIVICTFCLIKLEVILSATN